MLLPPVTAGDGSVVTAWRWSTSQATDDVANRASVISRDRRGRFGPVRPAPARLLALRTYGASRTLALSVRLVPPFDRYHLRASFGRTDGRFSAPQKIVAARLQPFGADEPALAVNSSGRALVSWVEESRLGEGFVVRASERPPGGRFGVPFTVGSTTSQRTAVAVSARGDVTIVFVRAGRIAARVRRAGHRWGAIQRLAAANPRYDHRLLVAISARGEVRAGWWPEMKNCVNHCDVPPGSFSTAFVVPGRFTFGAPQIFDADPRFTSPMLIQRPTGWALAYVEGSDPRAARPAVRTATADGRFGPPRLVAPAQPRMRDLQIGSTRGGRIIAGWTVNERPTGDLYEGSRRLVTAPVDLGGGSLRPLEPVSQGQVLTPWLVSDPRTGRLMAWWIEQPARPDDTPSDQVATLLTSSRAP